MKNKTLATLLITAALSPALAQAFVIKKIDYQGLQRISADSLAGYMPVHVGSDMSLAQSNKVISDLFNSGYFNDIQLKQQSQTLVVNLTERPTIASIKFSGNKEIKTKMLKQVLVKTGLQTGNMFNQTLLSQVVTSLRDEYYSLGKYTVQITPKITQLSRNRVGIDIVISEGIYAKISRINIVGNHAFTQSQLLKQLSLSTPGLFTFITAKDQYSQQKLTTSLTALSNFYMDHGYIRFYVASTQVSLSPARRKTFLTINVHEGAQYRFDKVSLSGDLPFAKSKFMKLLHIRQGDDFSKQQVLDGAKAISNLLGDNGYAFATVNPTPKIDDKNHTVNITYYINPGHQAYIRNINFSGNNVTNDITLRHQMRFVEGSRYNLQKINASKDRLLRYYSFLTSATEKTIPVPGSNDQVNVDYKVLENNSANSMSFSLGYSQLDKVLVGANLGMPNIFGTGDTFNISTQLSKPYRTLNLGLTQPFFTLSGVQQSFNIYLTNVNNTDRNLANYSTNSYGATLNYSIPANNDDFFIIGAGVDHTSLEQPNEGASETVTAYTTAHGNDFNTLSINLGWRRNLLNSVFFPTKGYSTSINSTIATPISSQAWYKLMATANWYHPITDNYTFSLYGQADFGNGYGKTDNLPFFDNFFGGGWGSVRGYQEGSLGPKDKINNGSSPATQGDSIGGNLLLDLSANVYFPVPFTKPNPKLRMLVFADMGNVYQTYNSKTIYTEDGVTSPTRPNFSNLRYSVGLGIQWVSPLGPLAFSLAKALNSKPGDNTAIFNFTLGQTF